MTAGYDLRVRCPVDDRALTDLHALAFGDPPPDPTPPPTPWAARLDRHALTWVGAAAAGELVGFVQVCWDGGSHAFLLDTVVHPAHRGRGVGRARVAAAVAEVAAAGCAWLHVDYAPELAAFYEGACGFRPTSAGLLSLR